MIQNQTLTITNKAKGTYRTLMIKTVRDGNLKGKQIVALLSGPDNENDYQGFGFVTDAGIKVWSSKKTAFFTTLSAMVEQYLGIHRYGFTFKDIEFKEAKRCMVCNRLLTTPESIARGVGPECATRGN